MIVQKKLSPYLMIDDDAMEDFEGHFKTNTEPAIADSVLVGLAPDKFNYKQMNIAMNILLRENAALVAIHKGRFYQRKDGLALGPGPFVTALEHSTDRKALVVGKPERSFFEAAIKPFDCLPQEVAMIGDVSFQMYKFETPVIYGSFPLSTQNRMSATTSAVPSKQEWSDFWCEPANIARRTRTKLILRQTMFAIPSWKRLSSF